MDSSEVIEMAVNQVPIDAFTALHYAGGVGMKVVGLNPPAALALAVLWELAEPPLKQRYPSQFPHPSVDSFANKCFDVIAAMIGYYAPLPKYTPLTSYG